MEKVIKQTGARLIISGEVQRVGFRGRIKKTAHSLSLSGFARNRSDGKVDAEVEGEESKIRELIDWMKKRSYTTVTDVSVSWRPFQGKFTEFIINE